MTWDDDACLCMPQPCNAVEDARISIARVWRGIIRPLISSTSIGINPSFFARITTHRYVSVHLRASNLLHCSLL